MTKTNSLPLGSPSKEPCVPLVIAAAELSLSPNGLLYILRKTKSAIRDDGRWYVKRSEVLKIEKARRDLGLGRNHPSGSVA
jgi:hypothetical protein